MCINRRAFGHGGFLMTTSMTTTEKRTNDQRWDRGSAAGRREHEKGDEPRDDQIGRGCKKGHHQKGWLARLVTEQQNREPGPGKSTDQLQNMKMALGRAPSMPASGTLVTSEREEGVHTRDRRPDREADDGDLSRIRWNREQGRHGFTLLLPWAWSEREMRSMPESRPRWRRNPR